MSSWALTLEALSTWNFVLLSLLFQKLLESLTLWDNTPFRQNTINIKWPCRFHGPLGTSCSVALVLAQSCVLWSIRGLEYFWNTLLLLKPQDVILNEFPRDYHDLLRWELQYCYSWKACAVGQSAACLQAALEALWKWKNIIYWKIMAALTFFVVCLFCSIQNMDSTLKKDQLKSSIWALSLELFTLDPPQ